MSVTQQFNTTSSMGRLTRELLLSFAQLSGRSPATSTTDPASKKGMWMGGNVPLGYDASGRSSSTLPSRAVHHRSVPELGCVRRVKEEADRLGLRTKCSTAANGIRRGKPFSRGHLYDLLANPFIPGRLRTRVSSTPANIRR